MEAGGALFRWVMRLGHSSLEICIRTASDHGTMLRHSVGPCSPLKTKPKMRYRTSGADVQTAAANCAACSAFVTWVPHRSSRSATGMGWRATAGEGPVSGAQTGPPPPPVVASSRG
ncbi:uncharacterized protein LOC144100321 [Amblyomma americanum]